MPCLSRIKKLTKPVCSLASWFFPASTFDRSPAVETRAAQTTSESEAECFTNSTVTSLLNFKGIDGVEELVTKTHDTVYLR